MLKSIFLLLLISSILVFAQNCNPVNNTPLFSTASSRIGTAEASSGNGQGYDGKLTYINLMPDGQLCSDGTKVRAKAEKMAGDVSLIRENCKDQAARKLSPSEYRIASTNPNQLFINYLIFNTVNPSPSSDSALLACFNPSLSDGLRQILILSHSSGPPTAQIYRDGSAVSEVNVLQVGSNLQPSYMAISLGPSSPSLLVSTSGMETINGMNGLVQYQPAGEAAIGANMICSTP